MAILAGLKAGKGIDANDTWDMSWRHVVYVELPNGKQVSWHMSPDCLNLIESLPEYKGQWDGSFIGREFGWSQQIVCERRRNPDSIRL